MEERMISTMSPKKVIEEMGTDPLKGLSEEQVIRRLKIYGENKIEEKGGRKLSEIVLSQFKNSLLLLLLVAAAVSFYIGQEVEAAGIVLAVILSVIFGTYLEYKADKSIEELSKYTEDRVVVLRNGKMYFIASRELVPGDVVLLSEGQRVPADIYLLESKDLEVDESLLTGESHAVLKKAGILREKAPLAETTNMLFAGTDILRGTAKGIVVKTGLETEVGKISKKLKSIEEEESELYKDVAELGKGISAIAIGIILMFLFAGILKGGNIVELLLLSITLAVAAIPEGLTTVLTIILALGINRMAKNNAIVRKLATIESLGRVDVIATDKTGTITEGKVSLTGIRYRGRKFSKREFRKIAKLIEKVFLATEVKITDKGIVGNEVDVAIAEVIKEFGKLRPSEEVVDIVPFSSEIGFMKVKLKDGTELLKGAPEVILKQATHYVSANGKEIKITPKVLEGIEDMIAEESSKGIKVIAFAERKKRHITLVALLSFRDPPKKGVKETIEMLRKAGIEVVMITGDNPLTAKAIGEEVSIEGNAILWEDIKGLSDDLLYEKVVKDKIIARATPEAKLRIVEVLSKRNVVAVTGDGVNDALALKKAAIGVVMGSHGTAVSREVADIVLTDDNFATLAKAIEIGRNIIQNIKNFLRFQLTANVSALLLIFYGFMSQNEGVLFALTPLQILWINLILDGPPALAQGFEPPKKDVMSRGPEKKIKLLDNTLIKLIVFSSLFISAVSFMFFVMSKEPFKALMMSFTTLVFFQLWNSFNCRSIKSHFFEKIGENKVLVYTVLVMAAIQVIISHNISLAEVFIPSEIATCEGCTEALSLLEIFLIIVSTSSIVVLDEVRKVIGVWTD